LELRQGPKEIATSRNGMVSSSHPNVSKIMVDILKKGGNFRETCFKPHIIKERFQ
jgi:gamma-glutamyltranspeptidase